MPELPSHADERTGSMGDPKGVGLAIAGVLVTYVVILPFVAVLLLYASLTVYAIVRAIGPGAGENPVAIVLIFVFNTTALVILMAVAVHLVGRSLTPKKRRSKA